MKFSLLAVTPTTSAEAAASIMMTKEIPSEKCLLPKKQPTRFPYSCIYVFSRNNTPSEKEHPEHPVKEKKTEIFVL